MRPTRTGPVYRQQAWPDVPLLLYVGVRRDTYRLCKQYATERHIAVESFGSTVAATSWINAHLEFMQANNSRKKIRYITDNEYPEVHWDAGLAGHRGEILLQLLRHRYQLSDIPVLVHISDYGDHDLSIFPGYDPGALYVMNYEPAGSTVPGKWSNLFSGELVLSKAMDAFIDGLISEDDSDAKKWETPSSINLLHLLNNIDEKQDQGGDEGSRSQGPKKFSGQSSSASSKGPRLIRICSSHRSAQTPESSLMVYAKSKGIRVRVLESAEAAMAWIDKKLGLVFFKIVLIEIESIRANNSKYKIWILSDNWLGEEEDKEVDKPGVYVGEYVLRQLRVLRELQNIPILIFASPKTMPRTRCVTKFRLAGSTSSYEVVHFYINTLAGESDSRIWAQFDVKKDQL